ncbi:MAG: methylated-DNA--[protein]-cysteine S-methyltransferase [Sedimentisphaerales bacterium]|nr:methylated-DNA--[protein]-cysteine S-methyltransferase [Sedimentisphaerales bacterium]
MAIRLLTKPPAPAAPLEYTLVETAWGPLAFASSGRRVCGLMLPGGGRASPRRIIRAAWPGARRNAKLLTSLQAALQGYFRGRPLAFDGEVDISWATPFARRVYQACCRIPPGATITYGRLARRAGCPGAARAVGAALAANRVPLLIGCHRVVRSDGALGGFSAEGGPSLKRRLLEHEAAMFAGGL